MERFSAERQRRRIDNINSAEKGNKKYFRRHRIRDYLPGQATYNLGDYPNPFKITPTEYDYEHLKSLAESGVKLIQVHEEWNDSLRCLGGDKYTSHDPEGMKKFVDLCHSFGMKIIPYISTGYFPKKDPDFRKEFLSRSDFDLYGDYFIYSKCRAGSPEWREYLLPRTFMALDEYGFDGIYNDWGYDGVNLIQEELIEKGIDPRKLSSFDMHYDPEIEDLLGIVYTEVKRRGGIYKLHADINNAPPCKDKVYDYLWIGENVKDTSEYGIGKNYEQYIVPCPHGAFNIGADSESSFAKFIPFMQFPLLKRGRPFIPEGIPEELIVNPEYGDYKHKMRVREYMKTHPTGPYVYSLWSSVPDDVEELPLWTKYMALYKPMVEEGSIAYIELSDCDEILSPISERIVASMFVNEEMYLVVSNLSDKPYTLELQNVWKKRETGESGKKFTIEKDRICFLVKE